MSRAKWRARVGPPFVVVGSATLLVIAAATLSAAPPPPAAAAAACSSAPAAALRAAITAAPARGARARVADRLGTRGQYLGRQIDVTPSAGSAVTISLPIEASVSQASPNLVVYTRVVSGRSEVRAVDLATGCDYSIAHPAGIVRSALLDPSGSSVYVHSVSGSGRGDAGVIRYGLGAGTGTTVVAPLPADPRFGPTFGTQLSWADEGNTLVVQSCGFGACRSRLLEVESGQIETFDDVPHGELIGVTAADLVAYYACNWSPCAVLALDRVSGSARLLASDALAASLTTRADGSSVVLIDTTAGTVEVLP